MKRLIFVLILSAISITGCKTSEPTKSAAKADKAESAAKVESLQGSEKRISFEGVSFTYDSNLFNEVKPGIADASPLQDASDKPDDVAPKHINFRFKGDYAKTHKQAFFNPKVAVYPLDEYKQAFSVSKDYAGNLDKEVDKLKALLAQQPDTRKGEIPYIPFIDASQAFRAHVKRADFQNGKGIVFLTQYNIEPTLINNQQLTYIFQGITEDGKYYVLATFPASASILSDNNAAKNHLGYTLPEFFDKNAEANQKAYDAYIAKVSGELEKLPPDKFNPDLTLFEKLVRSIRIEGK